MTAGLRERKKEATREAIAAAALRLASDLGPDAVTVEEIAEAAGVSARTFFNYFPTKEDALFSMRPGRVDEVVTALAARPAGEAPLEALRAALASSTESFTEQAERWGRRLQLVRDHPHLLTHYVATYNDLERALVVAMAERIGADPDRDLYPKLVVSIGVSAMRVAVNHWQSSAQPQSLDALVDEAFTRLETGFATP